MRRKLLFAGPVIVLVMGFVLVGTVLAGTDANPGDIVINEIMQNPSAVADADGEWFEIKNTTSSSIDINGWSIADAGTESHVIDNGGPLLVAAGGYAVLCRNSDSGANGGVTCDYQYASFQLANGDDEIIISDDGAVPEVIDDVSYDGGPDFPDPNGASMTYGGPGAGSPAPHIDNDSGDRWAEATSSYGDGDLGTPGARNDDVLGPNAITLFSLSAASPNTNILALSLLVVVALGAGAFLLRRRMAL